jgi:hypothetical protein
MKLKKKHELKKRKQNQTNPGKSPEPELISQTRFIFIFNQII